MSGEMMRLATEERRELAALLADLRSEEWDHPSLCAKWTVRDVAVHVVSYEQLRPVGILRLGLAAGLRPSVMNARALAQFDDVPPERIVELVRHHDIPRGLTAARGGTIALTDGLIHQQDIRRPLGRHRTIPPERLIPVLDRVRNVPLLPTARLTRGLRLVATDIDWAAGSGPELCGPGETLLMATAGRDIDVDELEGDGLRTFLDRHGRLSLRH